jgi:hypothetical protein
MCFAKRAWKKKQRIEPEETGLADYVYVVTLNVREIFAGWGSICLNGNI